ncbi:hypothetical protein SK128_020717 [Halocaridina rubra]|uniref:Uncharacterized protein n=1 Tax=Halocaridina rubra TaxID=373956 RepID=A0AAN9A8R4_HALRR
MHFMLLSYIRTLHTREPDCSSPIFSVKVKTEDNFTQTDCDSDLEELMMQLNFIVKAFERNPQDVEIKTLEDMNVVIYMMSIFSEALRILPIMLLSEKESSLSPAEKERLHYQKEKREKIISYVTKWYQPTYRKLLEKAKDSQRDHSN